MPEVSTIPASELCDPSRSITYGIVQPGRLHEGGVPIVRVNNFRGHRLDLSERSYVAPEIEASYSRSRPRPGDVLISLVGSIGQVAVAPFEIEGWNLARAVGLLPALDTHHSLWLYYSLQTPGVQNFIHQHANTTVQATFNLRDLATIPIPFPNEARRKDALTVLSALDGKIELNRRISETLDALVQVIFNDWFVDFGPVRRKQEGATNPVAILGGLLTDRVRAAQVAALFPNGFEDNGLPDGWNVYKFAELADRFTKSINPGANPSAIFEHYSLPAFDSSEQPALDFGESIKSNKTLIPDDAVLLSKLNPEIPRVWVPASKGPFTRVSSTEFLVFTAKPVVSKSLLVSLFKSPAFRRGLHSMVTGTSRSHQRVPPKALDDKEVLTGKEDVLKAFDTLVAPLLALSLTNREQNRTLAQTRDHLLPTLISGKSRVREMDIAG